MNEAVREYAQAVDALNRRDWPAAWQRAQRLLQAAPGHAGVHFFAGVAALELRQMRAAVTHLLQSTRLNPQRADYAAQWARALAMNYRQREAVEEADRAVALGPQDPLTFNTLAVVYSQANAHAKAVAMFRKAADLSPSEPSFRFNLATSLTATGDLDAAAVEYEACLALNPRYWKAHLALAQLRRQTPGSNHLQRLHALLAEGGDPEAQLYVNLALEKEYDDLGDYDRAFGHLVAGKAAWRRRLDYSIERDRAVFAAITQTQPGPAGQHAAGCDSEEPIFVIGMPRSGTTLVDRILSSHPQVHTAGELQNFATVLKRASGSRTPQMLDEDTIRRAANPDWRRLGEAYLASTRPGTGHTPHFIDKLPHNFLYAGHIARALPRAKLVCLRRDPLDTCVGNFRQLFALSSPYFDYSFDLLDTGRYYLLFDRLMAHWRESMPGRILEVRYEDIVEDQEGVTRRLLEHCGLSWDPACLRFEENAAPVSTASAVQVRSPIYRSSLQRWKRYEAYLGPLRQLLEEGGIATG